MEVASAIYTDIIEEYPLGVKSTNKNTIKKCGMGVLMPIDKKTLCEWKGEAKYFYIKSTDGSISKKGVWTYNSPSNDFIKIKGYIAVYPSSVDQCL